MGLSVRVYEGAAGVGGTWWWNRYPGARVDFPGGPFYCYTFSDELFREYDWAETQPDQPAVLAYLEHVADRFDLRRDIQLETWITSANYDESAQRWIVETSSGAHVSAQFLVCAVGTLSAIHKPDIPGIDDLWASATTPPAGPIRMSPSRPNVSASLALVLRVCKRFRRSPRALRT
jgi:cyclohexanone monooxygenase